jgi:hypothetical protein
VSGDAKTPDAPGEGDEDRAPESDRPTVAPPFDPEEFARQAMGDRGLLPPPASAAPSPGSQPKIAAFDDEPKSTRNLLAMVNQNTPTLAPPPSLTKPVVLEEGLSELDRAWGDEEPPAEAHSPASDGEPFSSKITAPPPAPDPWEKAPSSRPTPPMPGPIEPVATTTDEPFSDEVKLDVPPLPAPLLAESERTSGTPPTIDHPDLPPVLGVPAPEPRAKPARSKASGQAHRITTKPGVAAVDQEREMRDRFSLGDYTGALSVAEAILETNPQNAEAMAFAENCRSVLRQMYTARLGPLDRVPMVMVPPDQLRWLSIDHKAGFLLSHVDGVSSLEMILDVSGMPTLDALRILCELAQQRIISFR